MKKIIFYIGLCAFFLMSAPVGAVSFVEGLEDVPVMNGFQQIENDSISFGNEESRLIEAILVSESATFRQAEDFYKDTLPQMGWKLQKESESEIVFYREGEVLEMAKENQKPLRIRITVKSKEN